MVATSSFPLAKVGMLFSTQDRPPLRTPGLVARSHLPPLHPGRNRLKLGSGLFCRNPHPAFARHAIVCGSFRGDFDR